MNAMNVPSRLYIDLTDACQLACLHCCSSSGCASEDEMTDREVYRLIDEAAETGIPNLVFSGGEPLLRPETPDFLEYAVRQQRSVTLLTNGLLIDKEMARFLVDLGIRIKISMDGTTAATHDCFRGAGTFRKTIEVLRLLAGLFPPDLTVHYTVNRRNIRELPDLPGLLRSIGVPNMVIGTIKPSGRAVINDQLLIPPRMIPYVNQKVTAVVDQGGVPVVQFNDRGWGKFGCPAVCNKLGITARGFLTTCAFFGSDMLGDRIRDYSLAEIRHRHATGEPQFEINSTCASCRHLEQCAGGCRARAVYYHRDRNAPDPYACSLYDKADFISGNADLFRELIS